MFLQSMIIAFAMYSKIPMPRVEWNQKNMKYMLCFFPLVGAVLGITVYLAGSFGFKCHLNSLLFASIMTLLPVFITGGIHLDGFLDTIDALSSYGDKEKKLKILKDPNSGAFAIIGAASYFIMSLGVWSAATEAILKVVGITYIMSRTMNAFSIVTFPLAKNTGLAASFQQGSNRKKVQFILVIAYMIQMLIMIFISPIIGAGCIISSWVVFLYHYHVCRKYFDGINGDLAGYFLQICEMAMLISAVVLEHIMSR